MVEFTLNGQNIPSPMGWQSTLVNAIFMERSQPDISVEDFTFEREATNIIDSWIAQNGYFRGCPFTIKKGNVAYFDGYLDFKTKFIKVHSGKYIVSVKKAKGLNQLADKIEGYTMGLLAERQNLTYYDIPYVVVKKYDGVEFILLSLTSYMLARELISSFERVQTQRDKLREALTPSPPSPVNVGAILGAGLLLLLNIAITISIINALKEMLDEVINKIISVVKYHKGFKIKEILEKFVLDAEFNGIEFGFDIDDLYYFPSKGEDERSEGIPNANDYGYLISEQVEVIKKAFLADFAVDKNGVVQVRTESDPYFVNQSTFVMPDILLESIENNAKELKGTKIISFLTDITDEWTIDDYKGTSYEIHTKSITNEGEALIDGFEEVRLNVALAKRKDKLTFLEKRIKNVAQTADFVVNSLGGSSNLTNKITKKLGIIKVGAESWNLPKVCRLQSNLTLQADPYKNWGAKYLWDNYISYDSMVFENQKQIYKDVKIHFTDADFQNIQENSYFTSSVGIGKFTKLQYSLDGNYAIGDYWIKKIYDKNLEETYVEP